MQRLKYAESYSFRIDGGSLPDTIFYRSGKTGSARLPRRPVPGKSNNFHPTTSTPSGTEDIEVVGEVGNGLDAVRAAHDLKPDVVLMDLQMPELGGADATAEICRDNPGVKVLILTTFGTSSELKEAASLAIGMKLITG